MEGLPKPIGTTARHPFWSIDRNDFIIAGDLRVGEKLMGANGEVLRVEKITERKRLEKVYNIEVHGEHVYRVSSKGILVHNAASRPSKMQREVEKGQAPRDIDRVEGPHPGHGNNENHVHYKNGTVSTQSGGVSHESKGVPNPPKKTREWLEGHEWTPPPKPPRTGK